MCRIAVLCLLAASAFVVSDAKHLRAAGVPLGRNPGIAIRVNRRALDRAVDGFSSVVTRSAPLMPLPDVKATVSGVDITTRDMAVKDCEKPKIKYTLSAPNKFNGSVEFPLFKFEGPFNASRRTLFKTQRDSGTIAFTAKNVQVTFKGLIGESESGAPQVDDFQCDAALGPASLNVRNNKENFAVEVLGLFAKTIRPMYQASVCPIIKKLIGKELNRVLAKIPNVLELNNELAVKCQIRPQVDPNYIQVGFHAKVLTSSASSINPAPFVEAPSNDALAVVLISDAVFNDLAYQAFVNEKLGFTIDENSHPLIYSLVQLKHDEENPVSLGNVVPKLAAKYGEDATVQISVKATDAPVVEFKQDKAVYQGSFTGNLSITNDSGTFHEATVDVDVNGALQVKVHNNSIYARIIVEDVTLVVNQKRDEALEARINAIVKKVFEEAINGGILLKGLPLRFPFGIGVAEPLIKFNPHTLQIQCEIEWNQKSSQ